MKNNRFRRLPKYPLLCAAMAAGLCVPALALGADAAPPVASDGGRASATPEEAPETLALTADASARPRPFLLFGRGEYQFDADIDDAESFSVARFLGGAGMLFRINDRLAGGVTAIYTYGSYDFDDAAAFGGSEAWDDIHTLTGVVALNYTVSDQWSVFGALSGGFAAESGADYSSAFTGGGIVGAGYAMDRITVRLGVGATSTLEDDPTIFPVASLNWEINDRWQLIAGGLDSGVSNVIGVGVNYKLAEQWTLGAQLGYIEQRFRLDDSGFGPEGVGQDERAKGILLLTWTPNETVNLAFTGGVAFAGELRVEDDDGDRLFKSDYDPAPFVGVRLGLRF